MYAHLPPELFYYGLAITIVLGLGWGSFATMATYRLPRNMPWIGDKPRCFSCKTPLTIIDYFSILSYFVHRGTCRHCGIHYEENLGYFLTELLITMLLAFAYITYGFSDYFVLSNGVIVGSVIMATIDAQHQKIPSKVLITMFTIGAIYRTWIDGTFYGVIFGASLAALIAITVRAVYFTLINKRQLALDFTKWQHTDRFDGPGFDYVKLFIILGTFLSTYQLLDVITLYGLLIVLWRIIHPTTLRVGTLLTIGLVQQILYPSSLVSLFF